MPGNEPLRKPISLHRDDHARVNKLSRQLTEQEGFTVSLATTVMMSIKLMETKVNEEQRK